MNPIRWSDGGSADPAASAAERLFSEGARGVPPAPSPAHLDKLWTGAAKAAAAGAGGAAVVSVTTKVFFAAIATGSAATAWVVMQGDGVNTPPSRPAVVAPVAPRVAPAPTVVPPPVVPVPTPAPAPEPTPAPVAPEPAPRPRAVKPSPAPTKSEAKQDPVAPSPGLPAPPLIPLPGPEERDEDSLLVVRARAELDQGDPAVALRTLQERQDRFGPTKHSGPAGLIKTEALRRVGRIDEALQQLARLERDGNFPPGRLRELPLIRAELLVAAKRCKEAVPLFEQLVDDRAFSARARNGLAACGAPKP